MRPVTIYWDPKNIGMVEWRAELEFEGEKLRFSFHAPEEDVTEMRPYAEHRLAIEIAHAIEEKLTDAGRIKFSILKKMTISDVLDEQGL